MSQHRNLPRLGREFYQGHAYVHWTMAMEKRATGWLTPAFHSAFRERLLHSLGRFHCVCPIYCIMPDHIHLMILGIATGADQQLMARHFRQHLNVTLAAEGSRFRLQKQPYDHVLNDAERERGAFEGNVNYIRENPVRSTLAETPEAWPFTACMIPGYPEFDLRSDEFWRRFWRYYASRMP